MKYAMIARAEILFAASLLSMSSAAAGQSDWTEAAPLPSPRQEIYATTLDGLIFTAGGLTNNASAVRDDFLVYNPVADDWRSLANLPAPRHHVTLSAHKDVIYAIGGFSGAFPDWKPEPSFTDIISLQRSGPFFRTFQSRAANMCRRSSMIVFT